MKELFSPPTLSARYVIRHETLAGAQGNGRDTPRAVTRLRQREHTRTAVVGQEEPLQPQGRSD
jgi:hypothetical protein